MKFIFIFGLSSILMVLSGCTSQKELITAQAEKMGASYLENILQKESGRALQDSAYLQQAYVQFMKQRSKIVIERIEIVNPSLAIAHVEFKLYPHQLRQTLVDIARKVDRTKSHRFNFAEAVTLIHKQSGQSIELEQQYSSDFKFKKEKEDWVAQ